jgi:hypothetical protein
MADTDKQIEIDLSNDPADLEEPLTQLDYSRALLKACGISEVHYELDGSGDSGAASLASVNYHSGLTRDELPAISIGLTESGDIISLADLLYDVVYDLPDGDWINNEGGYGTITFAAPQLGADLEVECDMTYRDGEDYDDDYNDDDFQDDEQDPAPADPDAADADTITIDLTSSDLEKGDNP